MTTLDHKTRAYVHQLVEAIGNHCDQLVYFSSQMQLTLDEAIKIRGAEEQLKIVLERAGEIIR